MLAIYLKELRSYFINAIGYVYIGIFLAISALLFCYTTLISNTYSTSNYFSMLILVLVVLIPLLTMKLFAEEKKLRTEQMLLTSPVSITGMVVGKFLAAFTLFLGNILVSCINFIPLYVIAAKERTLSSTAGELIGPVSSQLIGCLIGVVLMGAAFIALGTFISSLTENQLAAAIVTIASILVLLLIGFFSGITDIYWIRVVLNWISVFSRFSNFSAGIFDPSALFYYVSLAFVFLFLTVRVYDKRRWG